jgi:hypothetical protein
MKKKITTILLSIMLACHMISAFIKPTPDNTSKKVSNAANILSQVYTMPRYCYPSDNALTSFKQSNKKTITFFTYGSLMDKKSASKTFSKQSLKSMNNAVAFGFKRVFDRDVAIKPNSHWGS